MRPAPNLDGSLMLPAFRTLAHGNSSCEFVSENGNVSWTMRNRAPRKNLMEAKYSNRRSSWKHFECGSAALGSDWGIAVWR